jgi:hypothetical protein
MKVRKGRQAMSIEANKATILRYYEEVLNRGNFACQ